MSKDACPMNGVAECDDGHPSPLGRPRGSTGHQPERVRYQLASLVVLGKRNVEIARVLGVSPKSVRLWLRHPEVQREIRELERELHHSTERLLRGLVRKSVRRLGKILERGDSKAALRAIELVWQGQGRLPNGNLEPLIGASPMDDPLINDREDARAAIALLRADREAREKRPEIQTTAMALPRQPPRLVDQRARPRNSA